MLPTNDGGLEIQVFASAHQSQVNRLCCAYVYFYLLLFVAYFFLDSLSRVSPYCRHFYGYIVHHTLHMSEHKRQCRADKSLE